MKKIISLGNVLLIGLTLLVGLFSLSTDVNAQNVGSLRTIVSSDFSFRKDLLPGDTDPDILQLQKLLNADIDTTVATEGIGSSGRESSYFGPSTKAAVIKFQNKYRDVILTPAGLAAGTGNVGKLTRTKLNLLIGVMTTLDSVGLPENRPSSNPVTPYVAPAATFTPAVTQLPAITICQFVEVLINIDVIPSTKANQARAALNCAVVNNPGGNNNNNNNNNSNRVPTVDIKVNGLNGPVYIDSASNVTISWTSSNVTSCRSLTTNKALSGSEAVQVTNSGIFAITCTGPYGTVTDTATVNMTNTNSSLAVSCVANPNNITVNNSVSWTATATGGTGTYTYSWSGDVVGTTKIVSRQYTTVGTKSSVVSVTSGSLTASATCLTLVNAVNPAATTTPAVQPAATTTPALLVSCAADPYAVEKGDSITWNATATGGTGTYAYSWSGSDGLTGSRASITKTYSTVGSKAAAVRVTSGTLVTTASCTASITATAAEARRQCNGLRPASTTDEEEDEDDEDDPEGDDSQTFGWFGGIVTEAGECEIEPEVYVPYFAIMKCGSSDVSQMSGPMPGYLIGLAMPGQTILGNAIPGITCMDRTDIPIGVVTKMEQSPAACGTEDNGGDDEDDNTLDQILNIALPILIGTSW